MPARAMTPEAASTVRAALHADLEEFREAFGVAADRVGVVERDLDVAGLRIRLRGAGSRLLDELCPAVAHRAAVPSSPDGRDPRAEPDLTIALWDSASTGVTLPRVSWMVAPEEEEEDPKTIRIARGEELRMSYRASERELVALDDRANQAMLWVPDPAELTVHVRGAPFLVILHWWLRSRGVHPIHAGAVGRTDGGVLLVGRGGSGKSSTAVSCVLDGMSYAADDYVALLGSTEEPAVASMYCTAKLDPTQALRFPELEPALRAFGPPGEKVLGFLHEVLPDRLAAGFPIRAILCPRVSGGTATSLQRLRPAEALSALAPSTLLGLPLPDPTVFAAMAETVERVPSFRVELGTDRSGVVAAVREVLEGV
jgi:hypothetical protein